MKRKIIASLLMATMLFTFVPCTAFASDNTSETVLPFVLLQAKSVGSKVRLNWKKTEGATRYTVYGRINSGRLVKLRDIYDPDATSYKVKKINGQKLKKHKVYKFRVIAYNGSEKISKSYICKVIYGLKIRDKKLKAHYYNPKFVGRNNDSVYIKAGETLPAKSSAGLRVVLTNSKGKHLSSKYGKKLRYTVVDSNNKLGSSSITVTRSGYIKASSSAKAGEKVKVFAQAINGVHESFTVEVIN